MSPAILSKLTKMLRGRSAASSRSGAFRASDDGGRGFAGGCMQAQAGGDDLALTIDQGWRVMKRLIRFLVLVVAKSNESAKIRSPVTPVDEIAALQRRSSPAIRRHKPGERKDPGNRPLPHARSRCVPVHASSATGSDSTGTKRMFDCAVPSAPVQPAHRDRRGVGRPNRR